jgi:DNA-binding MarR family transcriptional regulator
LGVPITVLANDSALGGELLHAVFLLMRRIRREGAQRIGMSYADLMILGYLMKAPGRGVSDLASEAGVSGPTMSSQIKRLEAAGMILRQPSPDNDGRRISLFLSPQARSLVTSMKELGAHWMSEQLGQLSVSEREALARAIPSLVALAGGPAAHGDCS